jgi:hypothetical protein
MKKPISLALVVLFAASASAQTIGKIRDRWNAQACVTVGLPKSCLAAEFAAVPVDKRNGSVYYSTDAAFRDGELLPKVLAEREERNLQTGAEAINRAFLAASPADRVAACTALKMPDPEVCR